MSDFALTDILQILALSRKTGTLSLESGSVKGRVIIEQGKISHAWMRPGESFVENLARRSVVRADLLEKLHRIAVDANGVWTFRSLIVESGILGEGALERAAEMYFRGVVGRLVATEKGKFGIILNECNLVDSLREVKLSTGLDVGEVLLESAKYQDEAYKDAGWENKAVARPLSPRPPEESQSESGVNLKDFILSINDGKGAEDADVNEVVTSASFRLSRLTSLLSELRSQYAESELSLLLLRYASEIASRGVLFLVAENEARGFGQFGVGRIGNGKNPDQVVRGIHIPLNAECVISKVAKSGQSYIGKMPAGYWNAEILARIGGTGEHISMFAVPLVCNGQVSYVIYGDDFPGRGGLSGVSELIAFVNLTGIALEKLALERIMSERGVAMP